MCVVEKETKKIRSIACSIINDLYGLEGVPTLRYVHNNEVYFCSTPEVFGFIRDKLNSLPEGEEFEEAYKKEKIGNEVYADSLRSAKIILHPGEKEFISRMAETSNPIIQICTLK